MAQYKIDISGKTAIEKKPLFPLRGRDRFLVTFVVIILLAAALYFSPKLAATQNSLNISFTANGPTANLIFQPGKTVGGVNCGPGVRQVSWSKYSPWCEPVWHGNNGGATYNGVTSSTITIDYREASSGDLNLAYSIIPKEIIGTNQQAIDTIQAYVNVFNKYFELYGRKVVLVPFLGQSDFIQEDLNADTPLAQADALTVASKIHSFADVSLIDSTSIYDTYLSRLHVVNFGMGDLPLSFYQQNYPYSYTPYPTCNQMAEADAAVLGKAYAGLPAIFAGDPAMHTQPGTIGITYPEGTNSAVCIGTMVNLLENTYHVKPAVVASYTLDFATFAQQEAAIFAKLKDNNVNTVVCEGCDPVAPKLFLNYASTNGYFPQWYAEALGAQTGGVDAFGRATASGKANMPQDEMSHTVLISRASTLPQDTEAYEVFQMGKTPGMQLEPVYPLVYAQVLLLFLGLQAAGPDLTPTTFAEGLASLPTSEPGGEFGQWKFGPNTVTPTNTFQITYWDPNATSLIDGKKGAFVACNNGQEFNWNGAPQLPTGKHLKCFGHK